MPISIIVPKFESTDKSNRIWLCHHFEDNENMKFQYLGNEIFCENWYEPEIWYAEIT